MVYAGKFSHVFPCLMRLFLITCHMITLCIFSWECSAVGQAVSVDVIIISKSFLNVNRFIEKNKNTFCFIIYKKHGLFSCYPATCYPATCYHSPNYFLLLCWRLWKTFILSTACGQIPGFPQAVDNFQVFIHSPVDNPRGYPQGGPQGALTPPPTPQRKKGPIAGLS